MPRITLSEVQSLPDILSTEHYVFNLGDIPGVGDSYPLAIKCVDANIPGFSTESYEVPLHGTVRRFRGRKMYPRSLAVTFIEDSTLHTLLTLRQWMEQIVGSESQTSIGGVADYSTLATLTLFDQAGNEVNSLEFINCFVQDVPDTQVTGESSTAMRITATFSYDYVRFSGTDMR